MTLVPDGSLQRANSMSGVRWVSHTYLMTPAPTANRPVTEASRSRPDRFDIDALRRALGEVELPRLGDPGQSRLYDGRIPEPRLVPFAT
jgi:hypothetical protein